MKRLYRALVPWSGLLLLAGYFALCDAAWNRCAARGGDPHWLLFPPFAVSCELPR